MVIIFRNKSSRVKVDGILYDHELVSSNTVHKKYITCFNGNACGNKNHVADSNNTRT